MAEGGRHRSGEAGQGLPFRVAPGQWAGCHRVKLATICATVYMLRWVTFRVLEPFAFARSRGHMCACIRGEWNATFMDNVLIHLIHLSAML